MFNNTDKQIVIGIMGPKGSGKDTFADYAIKQFGLSGKIMTAGVLKRLCSEVFNIDFKVLNEQKDLPFIRPIVMKPKRVSQILNFVFANIPENELPKNYNKIGIQKYTDIVFKTPRELLQFVGTDLIQDIYKPFHCFMAYNEYKNKNGTWLITDMRFGHEYDYAKKVFDNFYTVRIEGRNEVESGKEEHKSESEWKNIPVFCSIKNTSSIEDFYKECYSAIEKIYDHAFNNESKLKEKIINESKKTKKKNKESECKNECGGSDV